MNAAAAATIRALDALEGRAGNAGARVLGPNVAAQTAAERELLTRNVLAAAREEALLLQRVANLRKWTGRLNKLGLVCAQLSSCNGHGRIYLTYESSSLS